MARVLAYLTFDGNCREAMEFYKGALGGELDIMTVDQSPAAAQMPKEELKLVMHAALKSDRLELMASDNFGGGSKTSVGSAISLMLYCDSEEEIRSVFPRLAAGGRVNTELRKEFWGSLYGDITDKFGLRWMLNYDLLKA